MRPSWLVLALLLFGCAPAETPAFASRTGALQADVGLPTDATATGLPECQTATDCPSYPCLTSLCVDGECRTVQSGECLKQGTTLECDDGNGYTFDICEGCECKHWCLGDGCLQSGCDDGNPCTVDQCEVGTCGNCVHNVVPGCCTDNADCDDDDPGTLDTCDTVNLKCKHYQACKLPGDCPMFDACTPQACKSGHCAPVAKNEPCCQVAGDCPKPTHPCLSLAGCFAHQCILAWKPGCCLTNAHCDDGSQYTQDLCAGGTCQHLPWPGQCTGDFDAKTACDDDNGCTIEYCTNGWCRHTLPKSGCCVTDADCNDGDKTTKDVCNLPAGGKIGSCEHTYAW